MNRWKRVSITMRFRLLALGLAVLLWIYVHHVHNRHFSLISFFSP